MKGRCTEAAAELSKLTTPPGLPPPALRGGWASIWGLGCAPLLQGVLHPSLHSIPSLLPTSLAERGLRRSPTGITPLSLLLRPSRPATPVGASPDSSHFYCALASPQARGTQPSVSAEGTGREVGERGRSKRLPLGQLRAGKQGV